jgi:hypothetical protein
MISRTAFGLWLAMNLNANSADMMRYFRQIMTLAPAEVDHPGADTLLGALSRRARRSARRTVATAMASSREKSPRRTVWTAQHPPLASLDQAGTKTGQRFIRSPLGPCESLESP